MNNAVSTDSATTRNDDRSPSLHAVLVSDLRQLVVDGSLVSGQRISEARLCAHFGVSRTPLREALKVLAAEGFVQLRPNRGAVVAPVDASQIMPIFEVKGALERLIGIKVAECATDEDLCTLSTLHRELGRALDRSELTTYTSLNYSFHKALVSASRNPLLMETYDVLQQKIWRYRFLVNDSLDRLRQSYAEHEDIMAALLARTPLDLSARLELHNLQTCEAMVRATSSNL